MCSTGVFWREPRALTPPSWINRRVEVWNESKMYPGEMETDSKVIGTREEKENRYLTSVVLSVVRDFAS